MNENENRPNWWIRGMSIFLMLFGLMTIKEGGSVLFIDGEARQAAGAYVSFVVWFNFFAGFAYIIGGIGLFSGRKWSVGFATVIAISTLVVFGFFLMHIRGGGAYEARTVAAMSFRSVVWVLASITTWKFQPFAPPVSSEEIKHNCQTDDHTCSETGETGCGCKSSSETDYSGGKPGKAS